MDITLTSEAFGHEGMIPKQYTCDGEDFSPPLRWQGTPEGARSLVLLCEDPDAPGGVFDHWVLFDLPAAQDALPENVPREEHLESGAIQGSNSFGRIGYNGPCPPGGTHRYYFRLYALDASLDLPAGAGKQDVKAAMEGHVLATGELMGRYSRS